MLVRKFLEGNSSLTRSLVCSTFRLARSSYYAMLKSEVRRGRLDRQIWKAVCKVWEKFPGIGYRKLSKYLGRNKKQIQRILQKFRGKRERPRLCKATKRLNILKEVVSVLSESPEKLARGNWILKEGKNGYRKLVEPVRPYQLWTEDWKEIKVPVLNIVIYVFVIVDVYTRQLMGYHISLLKDSGSALVASRSAVEKARCDDLFNPRRLILHRDNGSAYISEENESFWRGQEVKLSYADPGKPTQNPYSEAFISLYVRFWLNHFEIESASQLRELLTDFFGRYNGEWKHSGIGYLTPDEKLQEYHDHISKPANICPKQGS